MDNRAVTGSNRQFKNIIDIPILHHMRHGRLEKKTTTAHYEIKNKSGKANNKIKDAARYKVRRQYLGRLGVRFVTPTRPC